MICDYTEQVGIRTLVKHGLNVSIIYNPITGLQQKVETRTTPCNFGGVRQWFNCPNCHERCAILYASPHFACRKCHRGRYRIELEGVTDRAIRTAIRFRERHGQKIGGVVAPFPRKPKLMRWHTYLKARQRDKQNVNRVIRRFAR